MNNIIAAVVAFVYNAVAGIVVALHSALVAGSFGSNGFVKTGLDIAYWIVPHNLMSDAKRQLAQAEFDIFSKSIPAGQPGPTASDFINAVPGGSGVGDIIWWAFLVALMATLLYIAVRRRQV
jgi:hypothetical protein